MKITSCLNPAVKMHIHEQKNLVLIFEFFLSPVYKLALLHTYNKL